MCWFTYNKDFTKPLVAEEDIKVLKFFRSNEYVLQSLYKNHYYAINAFNPKVDITCLDNYTLFDGNRYGYGVGFIYEGYHSYQYDGSNILCNINYNDEATLIIEYKDGKTRCEWCGTVNNPQYLLYECIIPKGTKYYLNEFHEIVSENIIVKKPAKYKRYTPLRKAIISLLAKHLPWIKKNRNVFQLN